MSSKTLSYIDNVVSTYNSVSDQAQYAKVQVDTKTTTAELQVTSSANFDSELKLNGTSKNYKLPNADDLPTDRNSVNYYVGLDKTIGTNGELVFRSFASEGTKLENISGMQIKGTPRVGSLVYYVETVDSGGNTIKELHVDESNEYNTFNSKDEIVAAELSMLDYVLVSANKGGSGLGLYRLTLGNLVQSVQILASEISTIGSLTSNTKVTADSDFINFETQDDALGYNPKMIFNGKGLTLKSGNVIVPKDNSLCIGSEMNHIDSNSYWDGSISAVEFNDIDEDGHEYEGFNFQRVNYSTKDIKNFGLYFEGDQNVIINSANTRIGQNLNLYNSEIELNNASLVLSNATISLDQGLSTTDSPTFATLRADSVEVGDFTNTLKFTKGSQFVVNSPTSDTLEFDIDTTYSQVLNTGVLNVSGAATFTDTVSISGASTFSDNLTINGGQLNVDGVNYSGTNNSKLINSGAVELTYDGSSTEAYELFVAGGDLQLGGSVGSAVTTFEYDTGNIDSLSYQITGGSFSGVNLMGSGYIQSGGDIICGANFSVPNASATVIIEGNYTSSGGNITLTSGTLDAASVLEGGTSVTSSSLTYKENITSFENGLAAIMNMKPVSYNRKTKTIKDREIGFIAEDMEKVLPQVVSPYRDQKGIRYAEIIPVLVSALQEQQEKINELERKLSK